mmetsp:Transcript_74678/g.150257  ORF Transcript_74678/g.150257 Transcript_74678/m.150257 type:complete len:352 (-) Transcript_74678:44-1099(-)
MSLLSSKGSGGSGRAEDGVHGESDNDDEGPFAVGSSGGLDGGAASKLFPCSFLASADSAHEAVEAAARALEVAERALRAGERQAQGVVGERKRFESQLQASVERFGSVLATAHASGVADWPDVAQGCEEAEEGLRRVRDILSDPLLAAGEEGGGGSGVLLARAALDSVGGKIEAAESLVTNGWQRVEQQKAEAGAATELCRAAISRAADAKDTASVLGLIELPSVASALEAAGLACQAAALSVHQKSSLPLAVVTDDCRRAVESAEELERCVDTQKAAREHFEEAERQRTGWNRADAAKKAEAAQAQARPRHCAAEEPARPAGVGAGLPRGEESRHAPGSSEPSLPRPRGR